MEKLLAEVKKQDGILLDDGVLKLTYMVDGISYTENVKSIIADEYRDYRLTIIMDSDRELYEDRITDEILKTIYDTVIKPFDDTITISKGTYNFMLTMLKKTAQAAFWEWDGDSVHITEEVDPESIIYLFECLGYDTQRIYDYLNRNRIDMDEKYGTINENGEKEWNGQIFKLKS